MRTVLTLFLVAGMALAVVPVASSNHCESRLTVYGRASFAPAPVPPYHEREANACATLQARDVDMHTLPPNADQIMVRVNGAFGPALTTLRVDIDGMGFQDAEFTLHRTVEPGGVTYQLPEWLFLPAPREGPLTVTVFYPRAEHSVTYVANPVQLPLPPFPGPPPLP